MYRPFFICFCACLCLSGSLSYGGDVAADVSESAQLQSTKTHNISRSTEMQDLIEELKGNLPIDIFNKANKAFRDKEYSTAILTYRVLNSLYPFSEYAEQAWFYSIQAYYKDSKMDNVIQAANKFIRWYPTSEYLETICYLTAKAYFYYNRDWLLSVWNHSFPSERVDFAYRVDDKQMAEAERQFSVYLTRFPTGIYREKVEQKIEELHKLLARKEYYIAHFYFQSGQYIAAYNRIVALRKRYPQLDDMLGKATSLRLYQEEHQAKQKMGYAT